MYVKDDDFHTLRLIPDGCKTLIFYRNQHPAEYCTKESNNKTKRENFYSCLAGPRINYTDLNTIDKHLESIIVEFQVSGLRAFFNMPMHELCNMFITPQILGEQDFAELEEQILNVNDVRNCFTILDKFFINRIRRSNADILNFKRIDNSIKEMTTKAMASTACLSERQYLRVFEEYNGLTPKNYLRLIRFNTTLADLRAIALANNKENMSITEIAYKNGYYDLSHLNIDCVQITGYSPTTIMEQYKREKRPESFML